MLHGLTRNVLRAMAAMVCVVLPATALGAVSLSGTDIPVRLGPGSETAGNLFLYEVDLFLPPGLESGFYLVRSYNSRGSGGGMFGDGWTCDPVDIRFEKTGPDSIVVYMEEGREVRFRGSSDTGYVPENNGDLQGSRLIEVEGEFLLFLPGGAQWAFNSKGFLTGKQDPLGNEVHVTRGEDGVTPTHIQGPYGRRIQLRTRDGRIISADGPAGLRYIYSYDERDRLSSGIDPLGRRTRYEYGGDGRLKRYSKAGGVSRQFDYRDDLLSMVQEEGKPTASFSALMTTGG